MQTLAKLWSYLPIPVRLCLVLLSCPPRPDTASVTRTVLLQPRPPPECLEEVEAASAASLFVPPPPPPRSMHAAASLHTRLTAASVLPAVEKEFPSQGVLERAFSMQRGQALEPHQSACTCACSCSGILDGTAGSGRTCGVCADRA
jgi:hypothetical protein